jgi:Spy/CpxP family protein refolding chaperone
MKTILMKFSMVLFVFGITFSSLQAQDMSEEMQGVSVEMMANMTEMLDLSDVQQGQMSDLMTKYRGSIDWILAKYEGEEEPNVGAMIGEIRVERDAYRTELADILSTNQYETYMAQINQILTDMFKDLAEIRLWDIQPKVALTDKQVEDLTPILGNSMMQTVQLLFENAGEKLSLPKKVKIKNAMKKIEKEKRDGMENILTPAQLGAYDQYKEEQKAAMKNK